ncbi:MAG: VOC family protein [Hyphomicrobiales bacterium]|nr:VOC family protein [Hyphomicrobiales bacterium]MCP5000535.1 VOC family protein [Hyphomicrobiales bacterium]
MSSFTPDNAAVWFEIPVSNLKAGMAFYNAVLKTELVEMEMGPNVVAIFPNKDPASGVAGHIYPGKAGEPGKGNTIHLAVPEKLESAMDRVIENGGKVVSDITPIPAGRFVYCLDPDGNSIGLFN